MKHKLPDEVKQECLAIVRGYERRRKWYITERRCIIESSPCHDGSPSSSGGHGDTSLSKTLRLEKLESHIKVKQNRAVDDALLNVGLDLPESLRHKLIKAIMINCEKPRAYPYEYLGLDGISRRDFYRRRMTFLINIAEILEIE